MSDVLYQEMYTSQCGKWALKEVRKDTVELQELSTGSTHFIGLTYIMGLFIEDVKKAFQVDTLTATSIMKLLHDWVASSGKDSREIVYKTVGLLNGWELVWRKDFTKCGGVDAQTLSLRHAFRSWRISYQDAKSGTLRHTRAMLAKGGMPWIEVERIVSVIYEWVRQVEKEFLEEPSTFLPPQDLGHALKTTCDFMYPDAKSEDEKNMETLKSHVAALQRETEEASEKLKTFRREQENRIEKCRSKSKHLLKELEKLRYKNLLSNSGARTLVFFSKTGRSFEELGTLEDRGTHLVVSFLDYDYTYIIKNTEKILVGNQVYSCVYEKSVDEFLVFKKL